MIYSDGTDTRDLQTGPDMVPAMLDSESWEALRLDCAAEGSNRESTATEGAPMSTKNTNDKPATEGCAAVAGYAAEADECPYDCPDCGKKLTVIKGLWGCLCLWGGRYPTPAMIEEFAI